jgi:hypothetical protein
MDDTEFSKLIFKLNKKNSGSWKSLKALKNQENKEAEGIKFMNQYKFLSFYTLVDS